MKTNDYVKSAATCDRGWQRTTKKALRA